MLAPIAKKDQGWLDGAAHMGDLIQQESQSLSGNERNRLFQNQGGRFVEVAAVAGADLVEDGRAVATGDLDLDGDLDVVVSNRNVPYLRLLRNDAPGRGHWLAVDLVGRRSNRQGIGARLTLRCGDRTQVQAVQLGTGYVSQSATTAWFGLGRCARRPSLEVAWPSGERQRFAEIVPDRAVVLTEGDATVRPRRRPGR